MTTQNIYEYNKIKPLDFGELICDLKEEIRENKIISNNDILNYVVKRLVNKINELTIEQNHLMKDFELYKKAFKRHVGEKK